MSESESNTVKFKRPSFYRFISEHTRVWVELSRSYDYRKENEVKKTGDGHPVLVVPGLMGTDLSSGRLRQFIQDLGYTAYGWDKGRNLGKHYKDIPYLIEKVKSIHQKHDTKVTLIGWSLGGVYAREIAKLHPKIIRQLITMGSPFNGITQPNNAAWIFQLLNGSKKRVKRRNKSWLKDLPLPAPVPTTAIYSKEDGIVPWEACREEDQDDWHQNIEVRCPHLGMGFNPDIWRIIENRLVFQEDNWEWYTPPYRF